MNLGSLRGHAWKRGRQADPIRDVPGGFKTLIATCRTGMELDCRSTMRAAGPQPGRPRPDRDRIVGCSLCYGSAIANVQARRRASPTIPAVSPRYAWHPRRSRGEKREQEGIRRDLRLERPGRNDQGACTSIGRISGPLVHSGSRQSSRCACMAGPREQADRLRTTKSRRRRNSGAPASASEARPTSLIAPADGCHLRR